MCRCVSMAFAVCLILGWTQRGPSGEALQTDARVRARAMACPGCNRLSSEHLPNLVQVHSRVISGGLPEGDAAFEELKHLGVRTIISVDGARPNVRMADKYGLRYVHLPHGYDGIPAQRAKELAQAVREFEGTIYIHCHHGKHRSPAAAGVACVTAGIIPVSGALTVLKLAGTCANYRGLFQSVENATAIEGALLDELNIEFHESTEVAPMAEAMVALEQTHDNLRMITIAGWKTPIGHPDLEPVHEALLLREHFTELLRTDEVQRRGERFLHILRDSEDTARRLEQELIVWKKATADPDPARGKKLDGFADRIAANCKACHTEYRDASRFGQTDVDTAL